MPETVLFDGVRVEVAPPLPAVEVAAPVTTVEVEPPTPRVKVQRPVPLVGTPVTTPDPSVLVAPMRGPVGPEGPEGPQGPAGSGGGASIDDATTATTTTWSSSKISGDLGGKAPTGHSHDYAATVHTHDDRYYTEAEVDTALSGKAATAHGHAIGDVTNLQASLDGKAPTSHTHTKANITDFAHTHLIADLPTDATVPAALGTAAAGTAATVARRDHVHTMPTAADVGAAATTHTHTRSQITDAGNAIAYNVAASGDAAAGEVVVGSDTRLRATGARAFANATQTLATNTWATVLLDSETFDTDGFYDPAVNPDRFTVPAGKGGLYLVSGVISYASNATGFRYIRFVRNSVEVVVLVVVQAFATQLRVQASTLLTLAPTDIVRLQAHQTSAADLTVSPTSGESWMAMTWLGP